MHKLEVVVVANVLKYVYAESHLLVVARSLPQRYATERRTKINRYGKLPGPWTTTWIKHERQWYSQHSFGLGSQGTSRLLV